jgi:hypothetical protein
MAEEISESSKGGLCLAIRRLDESELTLTTPTANLPKTHSSENGQKFGYPTNSV